MKAQQSVALWEPTGGAVPLRVVALSPWCSVAGFCITPVSAPSSCAVLPVSPCLNFLLPVTTPELLIRTHPNEVWAHLTLISSTKPIFPNEVTLTSTGDQDLHISFEGTQSNLLQMNKPNLNYLPDFLCPQNWLKLPMSPAFITSPTCIVTPLGLWNVHYLSCPLPILQGQSPAIPCPPILSSYCSMSPSWIPSLNSLSCHSDTASSV